MFKLLVFRVPARRMRVEVNDEDGNRYTITFSGRVTRDKAVRLFDLVELLGGLPESNSSWNSSEMSKFDRVHLIIKKSFPILWFSSKDIKSVYESEFKEPINLSTVSTYLSRLVDRGILLSDRIRNGKRYRIITEISRLSKPLN